MANIIGNFNPEFFAQEALLHLSQKKGFASRIYRGYEQERNGAGNRQGDLVNFRRPSAFAAVDVDHATGATPSDIMSESVQLQLNQFKQVSFKVTDTELAYSGDRLILDHLIPAADALANEIDLSIAREFQKVPHMLAFDNADVAGSLVDVRKRMVENKVPMAQELHYMASPTSYGNMLKDSKFSEWQGAAQQSFGIQRDAVLPTTKYGFEVFEAPNVQVRNLAQGAVAGTFEVDGALAFGATTITCSGTGAGDSLPAGAIVTIGNYSYVVKAAVVDGFTSFEIESGLREAVANDAPITIVTHPVTGDYLEDIAFHPKAMALVVAPLPQIAGDMGAKQFVATDPMSGMSLRARMSYESSTASVRVILDALWGVKLLDGQLAVRVGNDIS